MELPVASRAGYPCWHDQEGETRVCFVGRGRAASLPEMVSLFVPSHRPSWLHQVHGARAVRARDGCVAQADALVSVAGDDPYAQALAVVTADCVPVLWSGADGVAAVHAGWRGIVAGVISSALVCQGAVPTTAWIGPAIGACCYEVSHDVAQQLVAASSPGVVQPGTGSRPHVDLVAAVTHQLHEAGVRDVRVVRVCTQCRGDLLWSYRREGTAAGRNVALIWQRPS